jgi:hypothetical protein
MKSENQMNTKMTENFHIVMEMTPKSDCRLVGSWLLKVAEAQDFLSQTRLIGGFAAAISEIDVADLQAGALEAVSALRRAEDWTFHSGKSNHALAVDVEWCGESGEWGTEFALLVQLGFFTLVDGCYQMVVPESVTHEGVQQAVLKVASTRHQPQRILSTMPKVAAEAMALQLRESA